ncbi:MAG: hypothetical protein M1828_003051 [Chrysothrix sp. TS-e1954]|nr:MAG: hypothetical protein M1828_003051 [Chrysothrix sp. TS-e1954]
MIPDPGHNVHQHLLNHVHLISTARYPFEPRQLSIDKAFASLYQAPRIVKEQSPVAWQYLDPPRDGTLFLAWQPLMQNENTYASDGYVWAEPESVYHQAFNGYTIELRVHESGFLPNVEQAATHRRVRYRFVDGPNVDPALEMVHYMQAQPVHHVPSTSIQVTPAKQTLIQQRRYLESQGALARKEFMLHDSNNWPRINMPPQVQRQAPIMPPNPYQMRPGYNPGYAQPPRPQVPPQYAAAAANQQSGQYNQGGPKTTRRLTSARHPSAAASAPLAADSFEEMALADEDAHNHGDTLDLLSPRDISITRYKQHDEWMAEILASPLSTSQIRPVDLAFSLTGELSEITEGIFEQREATDDNTITQSQVDELEKRVTKYKEAVSDELTSMREAHKKKLEEFRMQKVYDNLERQLSRMGPDEDGTALASVVRDAEKATGARVRARDEVVQVQKGGLQLGGEETASNQASNGMANHGNDEFGDFTSMDTAGEALDFYSGNYDHMSYAA